MRNIQTKYKGFSLVELMVAIVVGLILVAGVIELFVNNKQMYRVQDAKARMQENGRYAMQILADNILSAGYTGCATRSASEPNNTLNDSGDFLWDFRIAIQGNDATGNNQWSPTLDPSIVDPLSGTDTLTIRRALPTSIRVTAHPGGTPPGSADIQVNPGNGLANGDIILITDCISSAIFQITSNNPNTSGSLAHNTGTGSPGNATQALGKNYTGSSVAKIDTVSFFIRENINGVPSLFQRISNSNSIELVEGIENMQVLFGLDTNSSRSIDVYRPASAVTNWNQVASAQVSLLVSSIEDNLTVEGPQTYRFNGEVITPEDRRLRSVYTKTFTLRNKVP